MSHRTPKTTSREGGPATAQDDDAPARSASRQWLMRGIGLAVSLTIYLLLGGSELSNDARVVAAIAGLMAV